MLPVFTLLILVKCANVCYSKFVILAICAQTGRERFRQLELTCYRGGEDPGVEMALGERVLGRPHLENYGS